MAYLHIIGDILPEYIIKSKDWSLRDVSNVCKISKSWNKVLIDSINTKYIIPRYKNDIFINQHLFNMLLCDVRNNEITLQHAMTLIKKGIVFNQIKPYLYLDTIFYISEAMGTKDELYKDVVCFYILIWFLKKHLQSIDANLFRMITSVMTRNRAKMAKELVGSKCKELKELSFYIHIMSYTPFAFVQFDI